MPMFEENSPLIDIHNHLLYGLDDGAKTNGVMQEMLDNAAKQGVASIIATPHVYPGVTKFDFVKYEERLHQANDYCNMMQYALRVFPGSEIFYTDAAVRLLQKREIPTINNTAYVLVEWSEREKKSNIWNSMRDLANAGYVPIMAHVERVKSVYRDYGFVQDIKRTFGVKIQMDCSAVIDDGRQTRVRRFFEMDLVDYVASDSHGSENRDTTMIRAFNRIAELYGVKAARAVMIERPGVLI